MLSVPIPNDFSGSILGDFARGAATWGLINSSVSSPADVPSGNAYLGLNSAGASATFILPVNARKVGVLVESTGGNITLTAYNSSNAVIGTCSVAGTGFVSNWPTNFLGFNSALGDIAYISISGDYVVMYQLTFEACPLITLSPPTIPDGTAGTRR